VLRPHVGSPGTVTQLLFEPFCTWTSHVMSSGSNRAFVGVAILTAIEHPALAAPKKMPWRQARLSRHYRDPLGSWSGVVNGSSLESTMKTASKLADSLSLAFSLIL
jgi:hypothetical protein